MSPISANRRATSALAVAGARDSSSKSESDMGRASIDGRLEARAAMRHNLRSREILVRERRSPVAEPKQAAPRMVHREFGLDDRAAVDLYYAMLLTRKIS